LGGFFFYYNAQ